MCFNMDLTLLALLFPEVPALVVPDFQLAHASAFVPSPARSGIQGGAQGISPKKRLYYTLQSSSVLLYGMTWANRN